MYSGIARFQSGDLGGVEEQLRTSMRVDPMGLNRAIGNVMMASVLFRQERYAESVAYGREATRENDNPGGHLTLAAGLGYLGQLEVVLQGEMILEGGMNRGKFLQGLHAAEAAPGVQGRMPAAGAGISGWDD